MKTPLEDDIITNSDESRRLPDDNPEPLEGTKKEESNLLEEEPKSEEKPKKPVLEEKQKEIENPEKKEFK